MREMNHNLSPEDQVIAVQSLSRAYSKLSVQNQNAKVLLVGTAWAFYPDTVQSLIQQQKDGWPDSFIRACARARSVM